jgi:tetratricopeptide (TPR) repeat protein
MRLIRLLTIGAVALFAAVAGRGEDVTATRAWLNCQGGEGVWAEMRISGCNDVIASGKANGADLAHAYYHRGNAFLQKTDYRKAIEDYTRALGLEPKNANALHERCWARAVLAAELEDALSDCNESLRVRPNDAETLGGRGFVYVRLGFYRTAILDYDAALSIKPDAAEFLFARGSAKLKAGDADGAKADLAAARALDPKIEERFERYDAAAGGGGFWAAVVDYWRAAMRWVY